MQLLDENKWYNFDDSHISLINEEDVKSGAAYLFHQRIKTHDAMGAGLGKAILHPKSELEYPMQVLPTRYVGLHMHYFNEKITSLLNNIDFML